MTPRSPARSALGCTLVVVALTACAARPVGPAPTTPPPTTPGPASPSASPSVRTKPVVPSEQRTTPTSPASAATRQATKQSARPAVPSPRAARAARRIVELTAGLGRGAVSIEAYRLDTGGTFAFGAHRGMATASIAKLYILITLLLQHQDEQVDLDDDERDRAEDMITHSDNDAADDLYEAVGEAAGLRRVAARLGLRDTVPGDDGYWGFTTTSARDYVALLTALVRPGPLTRHSRRYVLGLLATVELDQHWGASAADDDPDDALVKDGWLPSSRDGGRWLVNSVGIVTVHGHRVLLAVLTQHGESFDGGVALVEQLAKVSAHVVA